MTDRGKAYVYLIITMIGWGSLYVAAKPVLEVLGPFTLVALRYAIALVVLVPIYLLRQKPERLTPRQAVGGQTDSGQSTSGQSTSVQTPSVQTPNTQTSHPSRPSLPLIARIWGIGAIGYFLGIGCQIIGNQLCAASTASLLNSLNPIVIVLLAFVILGEKPTGRQLLGVLISMAGAALIIGGVGDDNSMMGILFSLAAVLFWSLASVLFRGLSERADPLTITIHGFTAGLVLSAIAALFELRRTPINWPSITPGVIALVLFIGFFSTAVCLLTWNQALALTDAATCSLFYPLQALTSAILGMIFLNERLTVGFVLGGALIAAGILFTVASGRRVVGVQ